MYVIRRRKIILKLQTWHNSLIEKEGYRETCSRKQEYKLLLTEAWCLRVISSHFVVKDMVIRANIARLYLHACSN
jgi:hypothetical protein